MNESHIEITYRCSESYSKMKPIEHGRFCTNCNKTVQDFTNSTKKEIDTTLMNSTNTVCGHFYEHQISPIKSKWKIKLVEFYDNLLHSKQKLSLAYKLVLLVMPVILFSTGCHQNKKARRTTGTIRHISTPTENSNPKIVPMGKYETLTKS